MEMYYPEVNKDDPFPPFKLQSCFPAVKEIQGPAEVTTDPVCECLA